MKSEGIIQSGAEVTLQYRQNVTLKFTTRRSQEHSQLQGFTSAANSCQLRKKKLSSQKH